MTHSYIEGLDISFATAAAAKLLQSCCIYLYYFL